MTVPRPLPDRTTRVWAAAGISLLADLAAMAVGTTRVGVNLWSAARNESVPPSSWVYQPGWTIVQVALAFIAAAAALIAVTAPHGRRSRPVLACVLAAAVLGWCVNDGLYQVVTSLYDAQN